MSKVFKHKGLDTALFYAVLVVGVIVGVIVLFVNADTTPATSEDYAPLYEQVEALRKDFSLIGEMDNVDSYNPTKGKLVLKGGKECDLAVYFDPSNNTITDTQEIDKSLNTAQYIVFLVCAAIGGFVCAFIFIAVIFGLVLIAEEIKKRPKKEYY